MVFFTNGLEAMALTAVALKTSFGGTIRVSLKIGSTAPQLCRCSQNESHEEALHWQAYVLMSHSFYQPQQDFCPILPHVH